jgi:hypothetical protein
MRKLPISEIAGSHDLNSPVHTCLDGLRVEQNSSGLMKPVLNTDATEDLYIMLSERRVEGTCVAENV